MTVIGIEVGLGILLIILLCLKISYTATTVVDGAKLDKREKRAVEAAKNKAVESATKFKAEKTYYKAKADSLAPIAAQAEALADTTRSHYEKIPSASPVTHSQLVRFFTDYQSPDTLGR